MADIQLDLDQLGYGQPTEPKKPQIAPDNANPLVSFFQGVGGIPGGVVRGMQGAAADVGTTLGATNWANATRQDVAQSEPNLTGRPVRQAFNTVAEGLGAMAAPIGATLAAGAALTPPAVAGEAAAALSGAALWGGVAAGDGQTTGCAGPAGSNSGTDSKYAATAPDGQATGSNENATTKPTGATAITSAGSPATATITTIAAAITVSQVERV